MPDIPTQPAVFDGVGLSKLKIRGASYQTRETPNGSISVPVHLIVGYKDRRWELTISDVVATDRKGNTIPLLPAKPADPVPVQEEKQPEGHWAACSCEICTNIRNRRYP